MEDTIELDGLQRNKDKSLAVIIPAMNEADKIGNVMKEVKKLQPEFIVVVVNGSTDDTAQIATSNGAIVLSYDEPLGNDVGRAIGAMEVDVDTYLFIDADIVIPAEDLLPFVTDIESGTDMALNAIDWVARHPRPHAPAIDRYFINLVQDRRDLGLENVLTIPHAFSKNALNMIGKETLANPQLANALTIDHDLIIKVSNDINVLKMNKKRSNHKRTKGELMSKAYQRMHGDTVEACHFLLEKYGKRAGFSEGNRRTAYYNKYKNTQLTNKSNTSSSTSLILSIPDHSVYFSHLIENISTMDFEIIAIVHGKSKKTRKILKRYGIHYLDIHEYIGSDTAFAIGAELAKGDYLIFHDTAIPIDPYELKPFVKKLQRQETDIVINNQNVQDDEEDADADYIGKLENMHPIHIGNFFMNITLGKNDLTISSMLIAPYGMNRNAINEIGSSNLLNPCIAYIKAVQSNLMITPVGEIDIVGRINESTIPIIWNEERILGDLMEGLAYWNDCHGPRGDFFDGNRKRTLLKETKGYYRIDPFSKTKEISDQPIVNSTKLTENPNRQILGQLFIERLELAKDMYSPEKYEELVKEHLNEALPLHEYYIIAKMLLRHYETTNKQEQYRTLIDKLFEKYEKHTVVLEELYYLKNN